MTEKLENLQANRSDCKGCSAASAAAVGKAEREAARRRKASVVAAVAGTSAVRPRRTALLVYLHLKCSYS